MSFEGTKNIATINIKKGRDLLELADDIDRLLKASAEQAEKIIHRSIADEMSHRGMIASGALLKSFTSTIFKINENGGYRLTTRSKDPAARVYNTTGRRAGAKMPPIAVIFDWMVNKGLDKPTLRGAFLIARAIAARGISPNQFINIAMVAARAEIAQIIEVNLQREVERNRK